MLQSQVLTRVRPRGSARSFRSPFTRALVDPTWLTTVAIGAPMSVTISGTGSLKTGVIVYQYQGRQVAARLNDQQLVKFIDGVRLRGNGECVGPPVTGG